MESTIASHKIQFPLGAGISLQILADDPYPFFEEMHQGEPITWFEPLEMWYIARHADVRAILLDRQNFTTAFEHSTIFDTFGAQMLTSEGEVHTRYRTAMQFIFSAQHMSQHLEPRIRTAANQLIDAFQSRDSVELREAFASRLPVQTILAAFDMPLEDEPSMRLWYDSFERALQNFTWQDDVRDRARDHVGQFHAYVQAFLNRVRDGDADSRFLEPLVNGDARRLTGEEVIRNLSIIFFGGISTVEALILNSWWALLTHPELHALVKADLSLLPKVIDETMRWRSPVQTATRHVVRDIDFAGIRFREGDTIACLLGPPTGIRRSSPIRRFSIFTGRTSMPIWALPRDRISASDSAWQRCRPGSRWKRC
ncbi:cytochrome P450 [Sphingosinicella sp. GR2756]|uniref:Cytochrome P450 n=1 Tax=Sphingosinicella rhizophila TaxID=3050082 RepID=A0ABU3Q587_9SPHN|nr:cytochrome P450 [Sphingosinicella sp. GR2756]MDT9598482.1 cytochrome P450 [Sphingosinicella sp. GR2756]